MYNFHFQLPWCTFISCKDGCFCSLLQFHRSTNRPNILQLVTTVFEAMALIAAAAVLEEPQVVPSQYVFTMRAITEFSVQPQKLGKYSTFDLQAMAVDPRCSCLACCAAD